MKKETVDTIITVFLGLLVLAAIFTVGQCRKQPTGYDNDTQKKQQSYYQYPQQINKLKEHYDTTDLINLGFFDDSYQE